MTNAYIVSPNDLVVHTDNTPTLNPLAFSASQIVNTTGLPCGITSVNGKVFIGSTDELPVFVRYKDGSADILAKPDTEAVAYSSFMVSGVCILVSENTPCELHYVKHLRHRDNVKRIALGLMEDGRVIVVYCTSDVYKLAAKLCAYGVVNAILLSSDNVYFNNPRNGIIGEDQPVITLQATYYEELPSPVVVIDPAHGGEDPGNVSRSKLEKTFTLILAKGMEAYLKENYLGTFVLTRNTDALVPPQAKIKFLEDIQADFIYTCHLNALNGVTRGFECESYSNITEGAKDVVHGIHERLANLLAPYGIKSNGLNLKSLAAYEAYPCPMFISKMLYMDNAEDDNILSKPDMVRAIWIAQAEALAQALGLSRRVSKPKVCEVETKTFNVHVGEKFTFKLGAMELCEKLRQLGFDAYVTRE